MGHMRPVVECQSAPPVRGIQYRQPKNTIFRGVIEGIQTTIVAPNTVDDVPWR